MSEDFLPDCSSPLRRAPRKGPPQIRLGLIEWKREHTSLLMEASRLWGLGLTAREVALKLGVTKNQISGIAHRNRDLFKPRPSPIKWPDL